MAAQGYSGPGIWIRIQHRFHTRRTEWLLAWVTLLWGAVLLMPSVAFEQPSFAGFRALFGNENLLGTTMVVFGFARLVGLTINGARKNVTPHIRVFSAGAGFILFLGISYCYMLSGVFSTWLAIYPAFALCELTNVYSAAHDAGESRHGKST